MGVSKGGAVVDTIDHTSTSSNNEKQAEKQAAVPAGRHELTAAECEDKLGFAFSSWKKWSILSVIFIVQTSMNFNASMYSNGLNGIAEEFGVSMQAARVGAAIFLIFYAFGCELWAPWSEEFGRRPVLQLSLFFVNIWQIPVALAPNFATILVGRALGGLSSAGGSVTLGMIADMFYPNDQQYAVSYIVFSSVGGSIVGPIVGGFVETYCNWRWCIWLQLIFGGAVQILHFFAVPETRETTLINREAQRRRKTGEDPNCYGPDEVESMWERFTIENVVSTWVRPFKMFVTEPIVLVLSLLSGFSDALIFMQIQAMGLVYQQWGFNTWQCGLAFIPIGLGYLISYLSFFPAIKRNKAYRAANPNSEHAQFESRMDWLLWLAPLLPIGLIIFAWTSLGPPLHWIGPMIGTCIIGVANAAIYMATIDYMVCAYGPYSASATGGNGWARDFLAGVLTVPATPFYTNIGPANRHIEYGNTILFCISAVLVAAVYVIYWKGPQLRKRSPFAESLAKGHDLIAEAKHNKHAKGANSRPDTGVVASGADRPPLDRIGAGSKRSSYYGSHNAASRHASREHSRRASMDVAAI